MSDTEDCANFPDRETAQKLTEDFAKITGTDEALAQFYLQDREWNLERSVNDYFEHQRNEESSAISVITDDPPPANGNNKDWKTDFAFISSSALQVAMEHFSEHAESNIFKLISWNIDGLDPKNTVSRTKGVYRTIRVEQPDIIFFQEVIPETYRLLEEKLPNYEIMSSNTVGYFTAILVKKKKVEVQDCKVIPFYTSRMLRNLLIIKAKYRDLTLNLITSHLESTKDHAQERKSQLVKAFRVMQDSHPTFNVIFGGDLNLRDKELDEAGGIPHGIMDLWQTCGSRPECKYTWDTVRNDNSEYGARFRPQCRFDRIYFREKPNKPRLIPRHFGLIGLERLKSCQRFPSDHWGIRCLFDVDV